jgi:hypothetical protein
LHLISRVAISTVAKAEFSANAKLRQPGRPRVWGSDVKLRELFAPIEGVIKSDSKTYELS